MSRQTVLVNFIWNEFIFRPSTRADQAQASFMLCFRFRKRVNIGSRSKYRVCGLQVRICTMLNHIVVCYILLVIVGLSKPSNANARVKKMPHAYWLK